MKSAYKAHDTDIFMHLKCIQTCMQPNRGDEPVRSNPKRALWNENSALSNPKSNEKSDILITITISFALHEWENRISMLHYSAVYNSKD